MKKYVETTVGQNSVRILLGAFMTFAAIGHFTFSRAEFQAQVPNWLPISKDLVVILSGTAEISLGLAMLFWKKQRINTGFALAVFYILIFPGNIAQFLNHTNAFGLNSDAARLARLFFQPVLIVGALWSTGAWKVLFQKNQVVEIPENNGFYDYKVKDIRGNDVSLADYKGKVVLVVNTATKCGLAPQFEGLEQLHQKYKDQGLVILGFPSNQFLHQEPGTNDEVAQSCAINFGVTFPLFAKIDVNGPSQDPLYSFLKSQLGGIAGDSIKWNFTKFLIDKTGKPVKRFAPVTKPEQIEAYITKLL